jgi:hypothetical protein
MLFFIFHFFRNIYIKRKKRKTENVMYQCVVLLEVEDWLHLGIKQ